MSDDLESAIGRDAMAKVRAAGWTPPPPKPEPKLLVTMEESRERYIRYAGATFYPASRAKAGMDWDGGSDQWRAANYAADDWLVRAVNRRIIEGLPFSERGLAGAVYRARLLGAPVAPPPHLLRRGEAMKPRTHQYLVFDPDAGTRTLFVRIVQPPAEEPPAWPWME